ncbi:MAG: tetratricopeptide repeat protein, partial [Pseudomonadota bacterium]
MKSWWTPLVLLPLAVLLIYYNTDVLNSPLVYDDSHVIQNNSEIRNLRHFSFSSQLFRQRPLVNLTFALDFRSAGLDVRRYHRTNIIIHIINCLIVYGLARLVLSMPLVVTGREAGPQVALVSSLLFAVHPLQTQAVIFISQRYAAVAAGFYMLSVIAYLVFRQQQIRSGPKPVTWGALVLCLVFAGCAFLSKQNAASIPGAILAAELLLVDNCWTSWKKRLPVIAVLMGVMVAFVCYSAGLFRSGADLHLLVRKLDYLTRETSRVSRWEYLCTQFSVIFVYLRLFVWPSGQHLDWGYPFVHGFFDGLTPLAFLGLVLVAACLIRYRKQYPVIVFGMVLFFIALSVESSIIPIKDAVFEHRLYLPMAGLCLALSRAGFLVLGRSWKNAAIVGLVVLTVAGAVSWKRTAVWKDEVSLWSDNVLKSPRNPKPYNNLGIVYARAGIYDKALDLFKKAHLLNADAVEPLMNLGIYSAKQGDLARAEQYFQQALALKPDNAAACHNLATLYFKLGDRNRALAYLVRAVRIGGNPDYEYHLGLLYLEINRPKDAYAAFVNVLASFQDYSPEIYADLARAAALSNRGGEVFRWIRTGKEKNSENWRRVLSDPAVRSLLSDKEVSSLTG